MAEETKNKLYIVSAAIGLLVTAAGGWTAVVVKSTDVEANCAMNNRQEVAITKNSEEVTVLKTRFDVHQAEYREMQNNISKMQKQIDDGIQLGNERFIQIIERLPKR